MGFYDAQIQQEIDRMATDHGAPVRDHAVAARAPIPVTLLELVRALDELTEDATLTELLAHDLIDAGHVVLTGNFRGQSLH